MKKRLLVALILSTNILRAQDYTWPTNASQWLTSTFGESRPRRFHAGMDVKTWNQVGYEIYAVRDGYLMRMRVSPLGYGRVLYVKLDTGETAVYAHLQKFSDRFQNIAEEEQERRGRYTIEKQFAAGVLPVKRGELLGYTGQSGIGVPHLHFELRNVRNQPVNPLRMGFKLADQTSPTILSIAVRPLTAGSMVNGDFRAQILPVNSHANGQYKIEPAIAVSGKVGLAVSAYDDAAGVNNRYSVYSLKFFVDDQLQFQAHYDELNFDLNHYVELDRDYALNRNGYGQFYKLYKEPANRLSFYSHLNSLGGALLCREDEAANAAVAKTASRLSGLPDERRDNGSGRAGSSAELAWGMHTFRIEVGDYFGNVSMVHGRLLAGPAYRLEPILLSSDDKALAIKQIVSAGPNRRAIRDVEVHVQQGGLSPAASARSLPGAALFQWKKVPVELQKIFDPNAEIDRIQLDDSTNAQLIVDTVGADLVRLVAIDANSLRSLPYFIPVSVYRGPALPLELKLRREHFATYLRLEIEATQPLIAPPQVMVSSRSATSGAGNTTLPNFLPVEPNLYIAQVPLENLNGTIIIEASAEALSGQRAVAMDSFLITAVPGRGTGSLVSTDRKMQMNFWSGSLHGPLYAWVETDTLAPVEAWSAVGGVSYRCYPKDVPLAEGATVAIRFAEALPAPHQLGVYAHDGEEWEFVDNRLDAAKHQVSARVYNLDDFAIFRDDQPPEIGRCEPLEGSRVRDDRPTIIVDVRDLMSGFESEESILLRLDGRKLIAEYDPERDVIFATPKQPLAAGRHEYSVRAIDRSGNVAEKSVSFIVP